ncbi:hypothetical protein J1605_003587 [Eschrichtius robustus]|uniref:Uncharacterized protein n=1 Tax=Eschrichtius robustus TaxID=9764 RepID=A0AB34HSV9_ESCRO|nr:hypothetical protein J1605_003587 [Eschrichtius robustus]
MVAALFRPRARAGSRPEPLTNLVLGPPASQPPAEVTSSEVDASEVITFEVTTFEVPSSEVTSSEINIPEVTSSERCQLISGGPYASRKIWIPAGVG